MVATSKSFSQGIYGARSEPEVKNHGPETASVRLTDSAAFLKKLDNLGQDFSCFYQ